MPRSPGGRLDPGRIVGARVDWGGAARARETRLAARSAWFGIGVVGSYGTFYQQQFFPLTAADALGAPVIDSFVDVSAPRDLTAYNPAWSAPAVFGEFSPKTTVGGAVTGLPANPTSAYYPAVSQADGRVFATVTTKPADGSWFELLARVQNPGTGSLNCYLLVGFANAGTDSIELYKAVGGSFSAVDVFQAAEYSAGDTFALDVTGTTITAYKNGAQIGSPITDSSVTGAGTIGFRLLDNSGGLDNFGSGVGVTDAATRTVALAPRTTGDTLATSDVATRAATVPNRTASDALGTSDDATSSVTRGRAATDSLGTSDAATRAPTVAGRSAADSLGTSDAAARTTAQPRSAADSLGTSDAATRAATVRGRTASDSLATSDVAARAPLTLTRTATDALYNTYDPVIDADPVTSHWKLGGSTSAVDRKGVTDLPSEGAGLAVVPGITANAGPSLANQAVGTAGARFFNSGTGGTPYEGPYTMEAWVKPTADFNGAIFVRAAATYLGLAQDGRGTFVSADFSFENSAGAQTRRVSTLNVGSVYHLVITHDGSTVVMYVNGAEVNRVTGVSGNRSIATSIPNIFGASAGIWPRAVVDEVAWYSGALSAARVLAHYQAGTGAPVVDVATRSLALPRSASDSLGTSDAAVATTSGVPTRTAADSLGTSDAATRAAVVPTRSSADSLGTSDAATRAAVVQTRSASDTAGHGNGQADQLNTDTRASYSAFGAGAPDWSGSGWQTGGKAAGYYLMAAPVAWGNGDDTIKVRARLIVFGSLAPVGVGFVKPGSIAQGSVLLAEIFNGSLKLAYDGPWNVGGGVTITSISIPGYAGGNYFVVEMTRAGNSVVLGVRNAADSAVVVADTTVALPSGAQAGYGAGVALRPMLSLANQSSTGTGADWWEFGSPADVATRVLALVPRTTADALGTTDAATRTTAQPRSASDSLGTSDAATRTVAQPRTAADSLGTSDAATRAAVVPTRSSADTLGTSDVATRTTAQPRTATDALGTSDAATRAATVRARSATDTLGTTDAATGARALPRSASDSLGTSDAATRATTVRIRTATDTLGTSDVAFVGSSPNRSAADALGTSDVATRAATSRTRAATDALGTSDAASRAATVRSRFASDTLGTSDAAVSAPFRTASDVLGTSDVATRTSLRTRTSTDTLGTSDAATRAAIAGARSSSDVLGTSDLATQVASYARFSDDLLGSSDVAELAPVSFGRLASDTLGTDDQAERLVTVSFRFAADELGTTDSALAIVTRFASDTLGTSDVATVVLQAQVLGTVLVSDSPSSLLAISDRAQLELALSSSALTIFDEPA